MEQHSSKLLQNAVDAFASLPGIGRKTALRLVLYLLKQPKEDVELFGDSVIKLRNEVIYCQKCYNISDKHLCHICSTPSRDPSIVCIVENIRDIIAIENTGRFKGLYHVLGGIISPIDGIGPNDLNIESLINRVKEEKVKEVVLALSTTMEGDTTNYYIFKKINSPDIKVTTIARGIAIGDELEYADEITLGRSILNRTLYENALSK